ncbi:MAG: TRAP transporter large permease subunit [Maricaulaceae bacterium]|jgi:tripartite ATP-independent transporter DctM subunit
MNLLEHLDLLMFLAALAVLLCGFPVAYSLAGVALVFAFIGWRLGVFDPFYLANTPARIYGVMINQVLIAVPLFVFMGVMLEKSKIAEDLLETMGAVMGAVRGGLGISVVAVGALLAASTGIVGATVVTMGLLSLPTMLKRGYAPSLASGTIAASGTLGQIIPPSIVLVLLGDVMGSAYSASQAGAGTIARDTVSVGHLFAGALIPGLLLVGAYALYVVITAILKPDAAPHVPKAERESVPFARVMNALFPPLVLILAVLGSILGGIATPTEAAAIGAVGAIYLAAARKKDSRAAGRMTFALVIAGALAVGGLLALNAVVDLRLGRDAPSAIEQTSIFAAFGLCLLAALGVAASLHRLWPSKVVHDVTRDTAQISSMVFVILIGATIFTLVFRGLGGDELIESMLASSTDGISGLVAGGLETFGFAETAETFRQSDQAAAAIGVLIVMLAMFLLGFFLDFIEITFVIVPLVAPPLLTLGVDPVWLGVLMAINLQTSFLTPPFGFALFYLRGVAPDSVSTMAIYRGAAPYVFIQLAAIIAVAAFPMLATWLPEVMFSDGPLSP